MKRDITVSICMITYNHEKYIAEAIEGILMQVTNFTIELVVGEDFSTDNTLMICLDYQKKYPEKISLLPSEQNIGVIPNFVRTLKACTGKYTAICEGDDYWTDPYKLQKQVDFMEANPQYSMCFHDVEIVGNNRFSFKTYSQRFANRYQQGTFTYSDILKYKVLAATCSYFFRNEIKGEFKDWFYKMYGGDSALMFVLSKKGSIKYLPELMAAYRVNEGSVERKYDDNLKKAERNIKEELVYVKEVLPFKDRKYAYKRLGWNYLYLGIKKTISRGDINSINLLYRASVYYLMFTILYVKKYF